ncbi:MAG: hypothetical protein J2P57_08665, partial [Acidimicrobiaceae bacterium]|nr:hypothetical protein [Acidimicrobiaceae bacterium]
VDLPWLTEPGRVKRFVRNVSLILGAPLLVLALVVDRAAAPLVTRLPHGSNAYRVLARRTQARHD